MLASSMKETIATPEEFSPPKAAWGPGPWQDEPDRVEFESSGFPCLVRRAGQGHLCGYVAVPPGHPWHGVEPLQLRPQPSVHAGITRCSPCDEVMGICHVPKPGETDDVWWLGFDAGHSFDVSPATQALLPEELKFQHGTYRTFAYMLACTVDLAEQAAECASGVAP